MGVIIVRPGDETDIDEIDGGIEGTGGIEPSCADPRRKPEKLNFLTSLTKEFEGREEDS